MDKYATLEWRHIECDGVLNNRRSDCLLNRLFRRRSKKISKLRVTSLCSGNPPVTGGFPSQGPVTRKKLPFDDVIMSSPWISCDRIVTVIFDGLSWCTSQMINFVCRADMKLQWYPRNMTHWYGHSNTDYTGLNLRNIETFGRIISITFLSWCI